MTLASNLATLGIIDMFMFLLKLSIASIGVAITGFLVFLLITVVIPFVISIFIK